MCRGLQISVGKKEQDDSSAVHADRPLIISYQVTGAGDTKFPQAVTTVDNMESDIITSCRDGLGIFVGGGRA